MQDTVESMSQKNLTSSEETERLPERSDLHWRTKGWKTGDGAPLAEDQQVQSVWGRQEVQSKHEKLWHQ